LGRASRGSCREGGRWARWCAPCLVPAAPLFRQGSSARCSGLGEGVALKIRNFADVFFRGESCQQRTDVSSDDAQRAARTAVESGGLSSLLPMARSRGLRMRMERLCRVPLVRRCVRVAPRENVGRASCTGVST
jgi:hypothetical protein